MFHPSPEDSGAAIANAINAASSAAANEVRDYASHFKCREDYEPLEELAYRVQKRAVEAGCAEHRTFLREQP